MAMQPPDIGSLMKQAQQMQEKMVAAQNELTQLTVEGKAGGKMVVVTMNGRHDVSGVKISKALLDEDIEMLEDLVAAAVNDAIQQVEKASKEKISQLTAGLSIPTDFMNNVGKE